MGDTIRKFSFAFVLILVAGIGMGGGFFCGKVFRSLYLTQGLTLLYLFAESEYEYLYIRSMVDSEDESERMRAYYAVKEYGKDNTSFFIDRFVKEKSPHVKRLLVWILSFSPDKEEVLATYRKYYSVSDKIIQKAMRESAFRLGVSEREFGEKMPK